LKLAVVVQARLGSSRLPGKSLRNLNGAPMVWHVLRRVGELGFDVVLATSVNANDDALADVAAEWGVPVHRGSEWDVLGRFAGAARQVGADVVARVTADCPLWAPDVGMAVVERYMVQLGHDVIVTNDTGISGWPDGLDTEVFSAALLHAADARATDRNDREHVTPWMRRNAPHVVVGCDERWRVKLSVDTLEDFERVRGVMAALPSADLGWKATRAALLRSGYVGMGTAVTTTTTMGSWRHES
jgi:spore coat polysaccharide biosynthesis protein SpsF